LSPHPYIGFASPLSEAVWKEEKLVFNCLGTNTILIFVLDEMLHAVGAVRCPQLTAPVDQGHLLPQAPLRHQPDYHFAAIALTIIMISHFTHSFVGFVVGYTHISALLLGFPKQFGKGTILSVILERGSEYKCVKVNLELLIVQVCKNFLQTCTLSFAFEKKGSRIVSYS
jgi:hypothetical protein